MTKQAPVAPYEPYGGTDGWGEPDLDEVVAALERAYDARAVRDLPDGIGAAGAKFMGNLDWSHQITKLVAAVERIGES